MILSRDFIHMNLYVLLFPSIILVRPYHSFFAEHTVLFWIERYVPYPVIVLKEQFQTQKNGPFCTFRTKRTFCTQEKGMLGT